jgi:hypothetical protein
MRFPAREASDPNEDGRPLLSHLPRGSPVGVTLLAPLLAVFAAEVAWLADG